MALQAPRVSHLQHMTSMSQEDLRYCVNICRIPVQARDTMGDIHLQGMHENFSSNGSPANETGIEQ